MLPPSTSRLPPSTSRLPPVLLAPQPFLRCLPHRAQFPAAGQRRSRLQLPVSIHPWLPLLSSQRPNQIGAGVYKVATNLISFPTLQFFDFDFLFPFPFPFFSVLFHFPFPSPLSFTFFFPCIPFPFSLNSRRFLPSSLPFFPLSIPFPSSPLDFLPQQPGLGWREAALYIPEVSFSKTFIYEYILSVEGSKFLFAGAALHL